MKELSGKLSVDEEKRLSPAVANAYTAMRDAFIPGGVDVKDFRATIVKDFRATVVAQKFSFIPFYRNVVVVTVEIRFDNRWIVDWGQCGDAPMKRLLADRIEGIKSAFENNIPPYARIREV